MASKKKIIINLKTGKRVVKDDRKRYGFHSFCDPDSALDCDFNGTFRDNIREFVMKCGEIEDWNVEGCPTWCTLLVDEKRSGGGGGGFVIPLYIIAESVENSSKPYCPSCQSVGWSHHLVSKRRYHVIIPADDEWQTSTCKTLFGYQTHLLHGLIHCNGFGHLLRINGLEGGSKFLTGRDVMDLWDRICTALRARKITVHDLSKKRSMDVRLLYGIAYGHSWFGRWGYGFFHGSFGVTEDDYHTAIGKLGSLNLDEIVKDSGSEDMENFIETYRKMTEIPLITIKDLLGIMFNTGSVQHSLPFQDVRNNNSNKISGTAGLNVYNDVLYLYKEILLQGYDGMTISEFSQWSTRTVLDSKHFAKEWPLKQEEGFLSFVCRLKPEYESPGEVVVVPVHTTIGELKTKIECTLRDTYCLLGNFRVSAVEGLEELEDHEYVPSGWLKSGANIWVLGDGHEGSDQLEYEGGAKRWTVDCICGAKDDDGERMAACESCDVWEHTRCRGIYDADAVPESFLCVNCSDPLD
ncbi:hypothetical protein MKW94_007134 [Papaver nudicaule]|uniref:Zinc finger PHD-type domain-containing protein n=1 Tax=Papaver nudicaule TaxID=74823 RepID=A0AA42AW74_PAPNU|nr:hypothetical protein [Papaver nudicaule]